MSNGRGQKAAVPKARGIWGAGIEGGAHTFFGAVAAGAAGVVEKNAVSFLMLTSGGDWPREFEAFWMPFGLGTLLCVALGLRPAPGRRPPLRPLTPAMLRS